MKIQKEKMGGVPGWGGVWGRVRVGGGVRVDVNGEEVFVKFFFFIGGGGGGGGRV